MEKTNINYITAIPNSQYSFKVFLNDQEEPYTIRVKNMEEEINPFINRKDRSYLNELIYSFIPFIVDVKTKSIVELGIDKEKEFIQIKQSLKKENFNEQLNALDKEKKKEYTNNSIEKLFKKMVDDWKL